MTRFRYCASSTAAACLSWGRRPRSAPYQPRDGEGSRQRNGRAGRSGKLNILRWRLSPKLQTQRALWKITPAPFAVSLATLHLRVRRQLRPTVLKAVLGLLADEYSDPSRG